ncbi:MAG: nucleotidyltransferase domain-containing protein, partial [Pseudohongiellaceae bacterium]
IRRAGMGRGTIARELDSLVAAGILSAEKMGNQTRFRANPACPVYKELQSLVRKTFGIAGEVAAALAPLDSKIQYAFVYGSVARGEEKAESDLDLMIVGRHIAYGDVMSALLETEKDLGRTINPTVYTPEAYNKKLAQKDLFLKRVLAQPILQVMGSADAV